MRKEFLLSIFAFLILIGEAYATTLTPTAQYILPYGEVRGLANNGTNWWLLKEPSTSSGYLYTLNFTYLTTFGLPDTMTEGIDFDGAHWALSGDQTDTMYIYNSSWSLNNSFSTPTTLPHGVSVYDNYLWLTSSGNIYKYYLNGTQIYSFTPNSTCSGGSTVLGVEYENGNLWLTSQANKLCLYDESTQALQKTWDLGEIGYTEEIEIFNDSLWISCGYLCNSVFNYNFPCDSDFTLWSSQTECYNSTHYVINTTYYDTNECNSSQLYISNYTYPSLEYNLTDQQDQCLNETHYQTEYIYNDTMSCGYGFTNYTYSPLGYNFTNQSDTCYNSTNYQTTYAYNDTMNCSYSYQNYTFPTLEYNLTNQFDTCHNSTNYQHIYIYNDTKSCGYSTENSTYPTLEYNLTNTFGTCSGLTPITNYVYNDTMPCGYSIENSTNGTDCQYQCSEGACIPLARFSIAYPLGGLLIAILLPIVIALFAYKLFSEKMEASLKGMIAIILIIVALIIVATGFSLVFGII